jgi:protein phosphatase
MVHEPKLRPLFEEAGSLEELGKRLIDAANAAGGRDNITVILFRLEEVESQGGAGAGAAAVAAEPGEGETSEYDTFEGEAVRSPRQGVTRADADALPAAEVADAVEESYRRDGTVALSAIRPPGESESAASPEEPPPRDDAARSATATPPPRRTAPLPGAAEPPRKRRRRRIPVGLVVALAALGIVLGGGWMATRAVYFVGTDARDDRTITIFRGLPYDLPFGVKLYERFAGSGVTIDDVPRARRSTFTDHKLRSRDDAENLVIALERGQIE